MRAPQPRTHKIARIEHTIFILRRKLETIPSQAEADETAVRAAEQRVKAELQKELGAKFRFGSDGKFHLQMINISGSSENSGLSLFSRWHLNASRTVMMLKVKAA